jgi:shikimate kinase
MIPDRIFVFGYLGSESEKVAAELAQRLGRPMFSTDRMIESSTHMSRPEVLRQEGESGFRQRERRAVVSTATGPPAVILLGPTAFSDRGNRRTIQKAGVAVFVDATLEECLEGAIEKGLHRPTEEANERFTAQYESRRDDYLEADIIVETFSRDPGELADEVVQRLEDRVWTETI